MSVDFKQQSKLTDFLAKVSFWSFLRRNETKMVKMFNFHRFFKILNFYHKTDSDKGDLDLSLSLIFCKVNVGRLEQTFR